MNDQATFERRLIGLPLAARVGLLEAWPEVLRKRHPGVTWVAVESKNKTNESKAPQALGEESDAA